MEKVDAWIEEWLQLWPEEVESGGETVRTKAKHCVNKMVKFCKDHPTYDKSIIFAATQRYLAERKAENYAFTKRATYFISKLGQSSLLETYCEKVQQKKPEAETKLPEYNPINDFI